MTIVTAYRIDPESGAAYNLHSVESPLLPRHAIAQWARANVGGYWVLRKVGWEFMGHQLWELRRACVATPRVGDDGRTRSSMGLVVWKFITTMRRVKIHAPLVSQDEAA